MNSYTPLEGSTLSIFLQICGLSDFDLCTAAITKTLGIEPFQSFDKGQATGLMRIPASFSLWRGMRLETNTPGLLSELTDELVKKLSSKAEYLRELSKCAAVSVVIMPIIVAGKTPDLTINTELSDFCARANAKIEFDTFVCPFEV